MISKTTARCREQYVMGILGRINEVIGEWLCTPANEPHLETTQHTQTAWISMQVSYTHSRTNEAIKVVHIYPEHDCHNHKLTMLTGMDGVLFCTCECGSSAENFDSGDIVITHVHVPALIDPNPKC